MENTTIEDKVKKIIAETLSINLSEIVPEAIFVEDFGADSLDCLEIIMSIEEEFYIEINDEEVFEILTVKDAIDCVKQRKGG